MLWGKKEEELPEILRGKTPEQIAEGMRKAEELEANSKNLSTEYEANKVKLASQTSEFEAMKAKITELEANQKPPVVKDDDEPASIWTDPAKFVDERVRDTQNVALASGVMSAKLYARQTLSPRDAKIWTKYEKEIDQTMQGFTPVQRVNPQSWTLALTLIKGQHEQEIAKAESSGNDFFSEGVSHSKPPETESGDKLTAEEEEACEKFHWSKEGYLKQKKAMKVNQSERGGYAHYGA
jgi:hypothetical protein